MQKSAIMLVASGALIVIGLILLVVGNQVILEGVIQGNGIVSLTEPLTIEGNFDSAETNSGVFAIQVMEFRENTISAKVFDPLEIEISSEIVDEETIEREFEIRESGTYKLVIQSDSNEETQVFGAIGPLPDAGKKTLGFISIYVLIVGMMGLVLTAIYGVKKRKRSI